MKYLRLDSVGGLSGDMMLGVLAGLGVDCRHLTELLQTVVPGESLEIGCGKVLVNGLSGIRATVKIPHEGHCHRTMGDIENLLENSLLPPEVQRDSIGVFRLLAEAEGAVHGKAPEDVKFHEVGALDSIADIAGCCLAWHELGLKGLMLSPLPMGSGVVRTAHGVMPVPAPATAEIFARHGLESAPDDEPFELVTPTGAALAAYFPKVSKTTAGKVCRTVLAFGQRELLNRPNLVRGMLCETAEEPLSGDNVLLMECNLDDMTGEMLGYAAQRLLAAGALDVWSSPVFMKKQRPGTVLSLLCKEEEREKFVRMLFRETSTFGVRFCRMERQVLARDFVTAETSGGSIRVKRGTLDGECVTLSPEWEDCCAAAGRTGIAARTLYREAQAAASRAN